MILYEVLQLSQSLVKERQMMHELAATKGLNDPEVINKSQELDKTVLRYQRILIELKQLATYDLK